MPSYPAPPHNPRCQCWPDGARAFFCHHGHLTECHWPYDCTTAGCAHLGRYDLGPEQARRLERRAAERLEAGLLPGYRLNAAGDAEAEPAGPQGG